MPQRKIAIYARKSKLTFKGESIKNQINTCRDYIKILNPNITDNDILIFQDEGFSGKNTKRPQFQKLLTLINQNEISHLICYRLDRISRSVYDFLDFYQKLKQHNVEFISTSDRFDTTTSMGEFILTITIAFAELERNIISERISDNLHELSKTGRWLGGTSPTGYKSIPTTIGNKQAKMLEVVPSEAETIKLLFSKYTELGSLTSLETYCLQNNIKSKNNKSYNNSTLRAILTNPVYCTADQTAFEWFTEQGYGIYADELSFDGTHGMIAYNKKDENMSTDDTPINPQNKTKSNIKYAQPHRYYTKPNNEWIVTVGLHPPIISSNLFIQAQEIIKRNSSKSYRQSKTHVALLSGLLVCPDCNSYLRPKKYRTKKDGTEPYVYTCELKEKSNGVNCQCPNIQGNMLDSEVWNAITHLIYDPDNLVQQLQNQLTSHHSDTDSYITIINELQSKRKDLNNQINNLTNNVALTTDQQVVQVIINKISDLASQINDIDTKINHYNQLIEKTKQNNTVYDEFIDLLLQFEPDSYDTLSHEQKCSIIRNIVNKVIYDYKQKTITLFLTTDQNIKLNPKIPLTHVQSDSMCSK
ncbi:MAG: recombinase family protein [Oscillospiraceae bacterium]|nr:recombinase family protein [Oscillospiraceae bacterium]